MTLPEFCFLFVLYCQIYAVRFCINGHLHTVCTHLVILTDPFGHISTHQSVQHQLDLAKKTHKHQLAVANEQVRELRRVCRDLEFQLAERTQALQEKIKLLGLQNIYSQRLPKYIPTHLPPPEVPVGLDPSDQYSLRERGRYVTKPERSKQPKPGDQGSRRMKRTPPLERPLSQPPHSHNNPTMSVPEVECAQVIVERSDINPFPNETAFEQAENRVANATSDSNPSLPTTTCAQLLPEQAEQGEDNLPKQTEHNDESVKDASDMCTTEHGSSPKALQETGEKETVSSQTGQHLDLQIAASEDVTPTPTNGSETVAEELTHLKAKMEEMYAENRQLRLAAAGQKTPVDSDRSANEPNSPLSSDLPPPTVEQIELKHQEEERKARLLQTLDLLDRTDSQANFHSSTNNHTDKFRSARSEENNGTNETQREITVDFGKLNKRREQELWNELFGPESGMKSPKTNSNSQINRAHAGLSAKTAVRQVEPNKSRMNAVKQDAQQRRDMFGRVKPRVGEYKQPVLNHGKGTKQASLLPAIPGLTEPVEVHPRRMHPKYAQQRSMPDEDDSDFEEFHA
ncbi:hypothetical protein P879_05719 [Paragonimus westermani]|uniref:Lebercilin domain-containing protein n=1 Tax=Paragonimus westermani TaxID=34504 RepID=A0A8T0DKY1_9TREM|nr:hypothetical protein P879_05719 [Paragonimus westermani]